MKKIEAIVRPEQLEPLKEALMAAKINGITIQQVFGCGNQYGWKEYHRGSEIIMNTLPKVEFMMVVPDERVEEIIKLIVDNSQTGEMGDGKIFVTDVVEAIRIRSCERGECAL